MGACVLLEAPERESCLHQGLVRPLTSQMRLQCVSILLCMSFKCLAICFFMPSLYPNGIPLARSDYFISLYIVSAKGSADFDPCCASTISGIHPASCICLHRFMVVNWPQVSANYKAAMGGDLNSLITYASA